MIGKRRNAFAGRYRPAQITLPRSYYEYQRLSAEWRKAHPDATLAEHNAAMNEISKRLT